MRKLILPIFILLLTFSAGCGNSDKEIESIIQKSFKARADAVFLYKNKDFLTKYFNPQALAQSREILDWSPKGQWDNVKDLKYSYTLRFGKINVDGKLAQADVYETAIITWDYVDPTKVKGNDFSKEDAWSNRKHLVTLMLSPEGSWKIDQDIIKK